jgi:hypothetical protein
MIAPSNKIIATGIICTALMGSFIYVSLHPSSKDLSGGVLTTVELPEMIVPIYATEDITDTDSDNLKDWQEIIQGTDINNPDSDGDGTNDGAEVAANRNPLKKGLDDNGVFATELKIESDEVYKQFVPRSLTDNISKDLFAAYLQAKKSGEGTLDNQNLTDIAKTIAQEALAKNDIIKRYSIASIGTFPNDDLDAGKQYGEKFAKLYIQMLENIEKGTDDLDSIAQEYQSFSKNITAIYTPESLASTQAAIGNNFYNLAIMFSIIARYDQDPIRAAMALRNLKALVDEQPTLLISIANYFTRNGIIFENQYTQQLWQNI